MISINLFFVLSFLTFYSLTESCTSFYCINSCGKSFNQKGYKLILANNRDEDIYRPTIDAKAWPAKRSSFFLDHNEECDQSKLDKPYNLCAYGALDQANGIAPNYYSTWLGNLKK